MMRILTNNISSIGFIDVNVRYKSDKYINFEVTLVNKFNCIIYKTKNYKIHKVKWDLLEYK